MLVQFLIKSTNEVRVEQESDANNLHKQIEQFAHDNNYTLTSWTQTYRCKKSQGEIVSEWYICKYIIQFNDAKEPEIPLKNIEYNMVNSINTDSNAPWEAEQANGPESDSED